MRTAIRLHAAGMALGLLALTPVSAYAATVLGYWQFEDTPGFTSDSGSGLRTLTLPGGTADPTQVTLPGTGAGSNFDTGVASTTKAASFDGGDRFRRGDEAAFTDTTFTVEAMINGSSFSSGQKSIIGHWSSTSNQRSWLFAANGIGSSAALNFLYSTDGADTNTVLSGLPALAQNTDYYVAVTVDLADTSTNGITFYQKNLTTGVVNVASVAHSLTALKDSNVNLTIGATDAATALFVGLIDEVRYSDDKLAPGELLVTVPEPGAIGLAAVAGLTALARRRRRS